MSEIQDSNALGDPSQSYHAMYAQPAGDPPPNAEGDPPPAAFPGDPPPDAVEGDPPPAEGDVGQVFLNQKHSRMAIRRRTRKRD